MTIPVIDALARRCPNINITVVSRPFVGSVFNTLPNNVTFVGINPRNYSGLGGLGKLYKEIKKINPTHVCDLHDVLRTKYLRLRFKMAGIPVTHIVKDRKARKQFISSENKVQQVTSFERYADAIQKLDFMKGIDFMGEIKQLMHQPSAKSNSSRPSSIGIAPFAAHEGKIYPLSMMERVVSLLDKQGVKVYLFGAGEKERELMEDWAKKYDQAESVVGTLPNMAAEMKLIDSLDAMLTMDSGNMHLASLTSTPVYSIWGATHPLGGFLGWQQSPKRCIQLDMPCRPCSIYGNKPCKQGNYPCLRGITPESIVAQLISADKL